MIQIPQFQPSGESEADKPSCPPHPRGYIGVIGIMEKKMETTIVHRGYIGIVRVLGYIFFKLDQKRKLRTLAILYAEMPVRVLAASRRKHMARCNRGKVGTQVLTA